MKSTLIMAIGVALAFAGCQHKVQNLNVKMQHLAEQSQEWDIRVDRSVFSAPNEALNKSCEVLNGKIEKQINDLRDSLRVNAMQFFKTFDNQPEERPDWRYELMVDDTVFMATDQYISIRLRTYTFTGGAHGNTQFYAYNYDVKNQRLLSNKEILNYANAGQINAQLKANLKNPEGCFSETPTLELVSVLNFNATSVYFTFEPYILGPYSCGVAEITVPRTALKADLLIK